MKFEGEMGLGSPRHYPRGPRRHRLKHHPVPHRAGLRASQGAPVSVKCMFLSSGSRPLSSASLSVGSPT